MQWLRWCQQSFTSGGLEFTSAAEGIKPELTHMGQSPWTSLVWSRVCIPAHPKRRMSLSEESEACDPRHGAPA